MDLVSLIVYGLMIGMMVGLVVAVKLLIDLVTSTKNMLKTIERLEKQDINREEKLELLLKKILK